MNGITCRHIILDLFSGAGGLSLGFKKAGFQVVVAVEENPQAVATYKQNKCSVEVINRDIRWVDAQDISPSVGYEPGAITAVIGGVPCQGFSVSNRKTWTASNPKNHLWKEFFKFVDAHKPQWFVLENVTGMRHLSGGKIFNSILQKGEKLGYDVNWAVLNAADFGVPQFRSRIFIVGNNAGIYFEFPKPTHGPGLIPYVAVKEAIGDLPRLKNGASCDYRPYRPGAHLSAYQKTMRNGKNKVQGNLVSCNSSIIVERYKHIKPGQNWTAVPDSLMSNYADRSRCHSGIYYRLEWGKPSKVIGNFRKNMLIHPSQNRGLSVREAARLQSFPDDYIFLGSIGIQQQQVADAVPPLLAEAVARAIMKSYLEAEKKSKGN